MMQLNTTEIGLPRLGSALFWIAVVSCVVVVENGMQFILDHRVALQGLGVPLTSIFGDVQVRLAGVRGFFGGCLTLVFACSRNRRAGDPSILLGAAVPMGDEGHASRIGLLPMQLVPMQWGTAFARLVLTSFLLRRRSLRKTMALSTGSTAATT